MTAPCKDCQDRELRCHSTCDRYKEFRSKRDEFINAKYKQKEDLHAVVDLAYRGQSYDIRHGKKRKFRGSREY